MQWSLSTVWTLDGFVNVLSIRHVRTPYLEGTSFIQAELEGRHALGAFPLDRIQAKLGAFPLDRIQAGFVPRVCEKVNFYSKINQPIKLSQGQALSVKAWRGRRGSGRCGGTGSVWTSVGPAYAPTVSHAVRVLQTMWLVRPWA